MRLDDEIVRSGFFWIPGREENKIPGILNVFDSGRIELDVVGIFESLSEVMANENPIKRIVGHVEKDGYVTLEDCYYQSKNISFGGVSKSKVIASILFVRVRYEENEKITFNTLSFSVDCLDEWVGITGIRVDHDFRKRTASVIYTHPEKKVYKLSDELILEIYFDYTLPIDPNATEFKITQKAFFKVTSEKPRLLNEFVSIAHRITNFMCFSIDATVSLRNVVATSTELQHEGDGGKNYPVLISVYYESLPFSEKAPSKQPHNMLFVFSTIQHNAEDVLRKWLDLYDLLSPALALYFSTKSGAQRFLDGKFLALAQGLETYHRRTSNEKLMGESDFSDLVSTIVENCPQEHIEWLKGRLMHGNEISLRKRLQRIIDPFKEHLGNSKARSKLIKSIVDTRNYLTHYDPSLKVEAASGRDLWVLCQKMEVVFQLHFLKVIGFDEAEIKSVVKECYPLKRKIEDI